MGALSAVLRSAVDGGLTFWCPGCNQAHAIKHGPGPSPRWGWNGSVEKPTFTPSVLVTCGHYRAGFKQGEDCWCTHDAEAVAKGEEPSGFSCGRCHSFVVDGRIQFLSDCTHVLAGQTVDLPPKWAGEAP